MTILCGLIIGEHMGFEFDNEVQKSYSKTVTIMTLKDAYNNGKSQPTTSGSGIYALFYNKELKKIGKAVCGKGIFTRMSQYYRLTKEGCIKIKEHNKDIVEVHFFMLDKSLCWLEERRLQVKAADNGELMPWENKTRN